MRLAHPSRPQGSRRSTPSQTLSQAASLSEHDMPVVENEWVSIFRHDPQRACAVESTLLRGCFWAERAEGA